MSTNVSAFTTAIGWLVVIGAAGAYWFYNANKVKSKVKATTPAKQISKVLEDRKEPKSKKAKKDGGLSSGDQDAKTSEKKIKPQNPRKPEQKQETSKFVDVDTDNDDDAESNRKFALQFAQAQAGTKFSASKSAAGNRQKSVKQSRAQEKQKAESGNMTAGDADDDQSFTDSPEVGPTSVTSPVSNGISDMLEAPAPGPSVLKVTEPTNPQPAKKEKAKPAPAPVETKKQRQNRAKAEAAKVARQEEEKERKIKEEKQRRTAREAEGRAPKDGRQFMASQQPTTSAWTSPSANGGSTDKFELLDTTEYTSNSKPTTPAKAENSSENNVAGSSWVDDDERVKSAIEESREWSQVQSKKRKTKKEKKENTNGEGAGATSSTDEKEYTAPPVTSRSGPGQKWTPDLTHANNDKVHVLQLDAQDSEWVVS